MAEEKREVDRLVQQNADEAVFLSGNDPGMMSPEFAAGPLSVESLTRILVVEDSVTVVELMQKILDEEYPGIRLAVAYDLAEARARLAESQPDIALVDLQLPDGKGLELLPANREEMTFPVVIMTAQGDEMAAVEAMKAGALEYLVKSPAILAEIPAVIARSLNTWRHIVARRQAVKALQASEGKYRLLFERMLNGFALHEVICDSSGTPVDYRFLEVNGSYERLTGLKREKLVGRTVREVLPDVDDVWIERFGKVALSGMPDHFENYASPLGRWYEVAAYSPQPGQFAVTVADVTQRRQAEDALRESEERFRAVFNTAAAGMVILSPDGAILQVNPALCALSGYSEDELTSFRIDDITHPADKEKTLAYYQRIIAGNQETIHYEKRYLCKNGRVMWGHASVACVAEASGKPLYCVGLVQDITERKRMEEALRAANRDLDAFVHTVSHDLRNPLTPIIGYAELLNRDYGKFLDEQARRALAEIVSQGQGMLALLEDLLRLAQVGHLPPADEPADCNEVAHGVLVGLASEIAAAGVNVQVGSLPGSHLPKTLLVQLFDNLIGNAVRYAGKDGGPIEVGGEKDGARVRFHVRDHGPGIAEAERGRIFDLFYRGAEGRKCRGTGVGLATVQKIVRLYDGRVWVEETPGGGCTFRVEMTECLHDRCSVEDSC